MNARIQRADRVIIAAVAAAMMGCCPAALAQTDPNAPASQSIIGPNAFLSDGAAALMKGDWERGIQLTQLGLSSAISREDRAAGLANLCAGYAALKLFAQALEHCDESLAIFEGNWRAWQNRAAANLGLGRIDESFEDIRRGLQINPDSQSLQKTLAIAREYERQQQERMRYLLES